MALADRTGGGAVLRGADLEGEAALGAALLEVAEVAGGRALEVALLEAAALAEAVAMAWATLEAAVPAAVQQGAEAEAWLAEASLKSREVFFLFITVLIQ